MSGGVGNGRNLLILSRKFICVTLGSLDENDFFQQTFLIKECQLKGYYFDFSLLSKLGALSTVLTRFVVLYSQKHQIQTRFICKKSQNLMLNKEL